MGNRERGLYEKFQVQRVDGTHMPGKKHDGCDYFVLDLDHDPHAKPAILAYAASCEADGYEKLGRDLRDTADLLADPGNASMEADHE